MPVKDDYEVGRTETNWPCLVTTAMFFAETRRNALKCWTVMILPGFDAAV
jgi:hypothetical protein